MDKKVENGSKGINKNIQDIMQYQLYLDHGQVGLKAAEVDFKGIAGVPCSSICT